MAKEGRQEPLFNSIASDWWNPEGPMAPLHWMNPVRLSFIKKHLPDLAKKTVLDVGCGAGLLSEPLARQGGIITSIDTAKEAIAVAQKRAQDQELSIHYQHGIVDDLPAQKMFDVICALEIVEHVEDVSCFLQSLAKRLKPGGYIFLSTINRTAYAYFASILMAEHVLKILPKGTHEWQKFLKPSELVRYLQNVGVDVADMNGMTLDPLQKTFSLTKKPTMNYILVGCKTEKS